MGKWIKVFFSACVTLALLLLLGRWWSPSLPPLGRLFSPQEGFWQNAEPVNENFSASLHLPGLSGPATIWMDRNLVPHIFAANDRDLYFLQGYITAKCRLWQMELQVRAAAGRVSEILGPEALSFDRLQRRKGMVSGSEATWGQMETDSIAKASLDAYTQGINAWIATLRYRDLPLEYKLLGYRPEPWTSFKCALLIKYMSDMLTGEVNALKNTNARKILSQADFDRIYPDFYPGEAPIVPPGTVFSPPVMHPVTPSGPGWLAVAPSSRSVFARMHDPDNGSNNWAVSGKKTQSGFPILCNDPHLDLNLPSIWFEVQLSDPQMNVYGASLPGAPGVIIGFNDSIAFGETNAERDVKDYYAIQFRDGSRREYRWESGWKKSDLHVEKIGIRGEEPFYDTVAYTVFGPVVYDPSFPDPVSGLQGVAARWVGADSSDEARSIYGINHARNYQDFLAALWYFQSPGQNFAFADHLGNIAIWEQGKFPILWKGQGKFLMPGQDSTGLWKGFIPYLENPHVVNPARNFVSSANQQPTDSSYPYYYSGDFKSYRGSRINQVLSGEDHITTADMERLQTDLYNSLAADALPLMLNELPQGGFSPAESAFLDTLRHWDLNEEPYDAAATLFQLWWDNLYKEVWSGYLGKTNLQVPDPDDRVTINLLLSDTALRFLNNIPPVIHGLKAMDLAAFHQAMDRAAGLQDSSRLSWGQFRGTDIMHLTKLAAFSRMGLFTGGGEHIVSAIKKTHGPSWRMVVELSEPVQAFGIYPGGESGNPGSPYYDNMIGDWLAGRYYPLDMMSLSKPGDTAIKFILHCTN